MTAVTEVMEEMGIMRQMTVTEMKKYIEEHARQAEASIMKPYTLSRWVLVMQNRMYSAAGFAEWDGKDPWSEEEGLRVAGLRAKRGILKLLKHDNPLWVVEELQK